MSDATDSHEVKQNVECPECGSVEQSTHPGERGHGVHVSCSDCGFPLDYTDKHTASVRWNV